MSDRRPENPKPSEIEQGIKEVEAAAKVLLPTMVWINQDGEPFRVDWRHASDAQRDSARDTAAEILEAIHFDLVAAVRRQVESGTIEGEGLQVKNPDQPYRFPVGAYIVIGPVSDGGSESET